MGKDEIGNACGLGEAGYLGSGAVLRPGSDPVGDFLGVGRFVDDHLNTRARCQKQVGLVVVAGYYNLARFSGNSGVIITTGEAPIFQYHVVALLQAAPGGTGLNTIRFEPVPDQLAFQILFREHKGPAGDTMGQGDCSYRQGVVFPVEVLCFGIDKSQFITQAGVTITDGGLYEGFYRSWRNQVQRSSAAEHGGAGQQSRQPERMVAMDVGDKYCLQLHHGMMGSQQLVLGAFTAVNQVPVFWSAVAQRQTGYVARFCRRSG